MNTPSHFLINTAIHHIPAINRKIGTIPLSATIWGSIAPDIPLYLLSIAAVPFFRITKGWGIEQSLNHVFDVLFFYDRGFLAAHNFLHSPINLLLLGLLLYGGWVLYCHIKNRTAPFFRWNAIFLVSCGIHSIIDILTHHSDGPLLFFPFNYTIRFFSPISYWEPEHGGTIFIIFEGVLDLILISFLLTILIKNIKKKRKLAL